MKGFKTVDSFKALYYLLEHPTFNQRWMSKDLGWHFGQKINSFVRWLEDFKFIRKTNETGKGKLRYEVTSRMELVKFYSRSRDMHDDVIDTYNIAANHDDAVEFIGKNGGILCLTTALELYGEEYFRDPVVHAYVNDPNLLSEMQNQVEGNTKVILYELKLPDETKIKKDLPVTSPTRTIIDIFCNNMSYAAEKFIPKVWS